MVQSLIASLLLLSQVAGSDFLLPSESKRNAGEGRNRSTSEDGNRRLWQYSSINPETDTESNDDDDDDNNFNPVAYVGKAISGAASGLHGAAASVLGALFGLFAGTGKDDADVYTDVVNMDGVYSETPVLTETETPAYTPELGTPVNDGAPVYTETDAENEAPVLTENEDEGVYHEDEADAPVADAPVFTQVGAEKKKKCKPTGAQRLLEVKEEDL